MGESDSEDFSVTNYLESYNNRSMFATPSQRRAKVYIQPTNHDQETASSKNKLFWTLFDNKVMLKSHIELLNIQLSATSHKRVAIISQDASMINEVEAQLIFSRYFHGNWDDKRIQIILKFRMREMLFSCQIAYLRALKMMMSLLRNRLVKQNSGGELRNGQRKMSMGFGHNISG